MGQKHVLPKLSVIACVTSLAFFNLPTYAAGFQINEISPSLQGNAMAGASATSNDVSSMFFNPANLSTLKQNQVYLGGSEILPSIRMSNASAVHTVNIPGSPPSNITAPVLGSTSQSSISKSAFVPDGYFGYRINDRLVAGLALVAPFGLTTKYNQDSVLRFAADYSGVKTINLNPALSYAITDQWSVGVGLQAQYLQAIFSNFNGPYTGIGPIDDLLAATNPTYLKADGWGYGYTLGTLYQPNPCTRFGLGYRSMISEQVSGHGQQYVMPGATTPAPSANFPFNAETSVKGGVKTPAVLNVSAAQDIYNWTVKASAQMVFWDTFNQLTIRMPQAYATTSTIQTRWRNSFFGALGADYRVTPDWTLRGGVAYDQTPTRNAYRDPRIPDNDRYWTSIGTTYNWSRSLAFDAGYTHLFIPSQSINVTQASGSSVTSTVPLEVNQVAANYKGSVNIVALAIRYSF